MINEFDFNITKKRAEFLTKLGLDTPFKVVNYLPRKYVDYAKSNISKESDGNRVVIKGIVRGKDKLYRIRRGLTRFVIKVETSFDEFKIVVFNRDYIYKNIEIDKEILVAGKLDYYRREIVATDIFVKDIDKINVKPVYSLIHGVSDYEFSKVVDYSYNQLVVSGKLNDIVPNTYLDKYRLLNRRKAYFYAHHPNNMKEVIQSKRYLKYEEALVYSLMMQKLRSETKSLETKIKKTIDYSLINRVLDSLPFKLTKDQSVALFEILNDMNSEKLMYRLLQGDVGSGKTIVATLALVGIVSAKYQGVLMAPTDLLARQHYLNLSKLLDSFGIRLGLLVSSLSTQDKKIVLEKIKNGEVDIIIGTQSLIQKGVEYANLGLCVIDEQHRFGVKQRKLLHEKGENVELLLMSATPIPRTLAIAIFQDMDVSTIKVPPVASKDIKTKLIKGNSISSIKKDIIATLKRNEKIYVVCSLIENELSDYQDVKKVYETMKAEFSEYGDVYLLHGKLKDEEKVEIMEEFKSASSAILVSTTIIEIGIDIKEATRMIIYDANCFGLASLHQLRGRIGRGGDASICYLLCSSDDEDALNRLSFLENNLDGFEVARFDLASRGPGDIAGVSQSGSFGFSMCNIFEDLKIFECARDDAKEILRNINDSDNKAILEFVDDYQVQDVVVVE